MQVPNAWLVHFLTYGLHAVAWGALVAAAERVRRLSWSARHALWRLALFGPFVTTLLTALVPRSYLVPVNNELVIDRAALDHIAWSANQVWLTLAWCCGAASVLGTLLWLRSAAGLWCALRGRERLQISRWTRSLQRLSNGFHVGTVRLTTCETIRSPLVVGGSEICIPRELTEPLSDVEVDAVLAHEMAHLERLDGFCFPLAAFLQHLCCWQPLIHWVVARMRGAAELACDERAVEVTRDPVGLAQALASVATVNLGPSRLLSAEMARAASDVVSRVRRLTAGEDSVPSRGTSRWVVAGASMAGLLVAAVAIGRGEMSAREAASWNARMIALATRETVIEAQLAELRASHRSNDDDMALLTLQQELRHVRATQVWLERSFTGEWTAGQEQNAPPF